MTNLIAVNTLESDSANRTAGNQQLMMISVSRSESHSKFSAGGSLKYSHQIDTITLLELAQMSVQKQKIVHV